MSQAHELRVLFYRKANASQDGGAWNIFSKALSSFTQLEERELESLDNSMLALSEWDHIFLDYDLVQPDALQKLKIANLTLVRKDSFPWNDLKSREEMLPALKIYPCLLLENISAGDLLRIIHLYLLPKPKAGVSPLMEKGSTILGEKVQSLDGTGILLDRLSSYLEQVNQFELKSKIPDLRQLISAGLTEAFRRSNQSSSPYPMMDFQTSAGPTKIVFNLRFPMGGLDKNTLPETILNASNLTWHLLWQACDVLLVTFHPQYKEIEIHALISSSERKECAQFKTFLWKTIEKTSVKENLLVAPDKYSFHLISNLKIKSAASFLKNIELSEADDLDAHNLPEAAVRRIADLKEKYEHLQEKETKKTDLLKKSMSKIHYLTGEVTKIKAEIAHVTKIEEQKRNLLQRKMEEMQGRANGFSSNEGKEKTREDNSNKLIADIRILENEKHAVQQKLIQEQKKSTTFEQKYQAAYSEISARDREIQELKSALLKFKREQISQEKSDQSTNKSTDSATRIKEMERQEQLLKQDLKKAQLKEEATDKTLKLIQSRAKQTEQKLQASKASELELTKKIEELSAALRKSSKVA